MDNSSSASGIEVDGQNNPSNCLNFYAYNIMGMHLGMSRQVALLSACGELMMFFKLTWR